MNQNLHLDVKCPSCLTAFHLIPEELDPERKSYHCPRCGTEVDLTPDQKKIATDLLRLHLEEKRES